MPKSKKWDGGALADLLKQYGPLSFGWNKTVGGKTYGHRSVLIGYDARKNEVIFTIRRTRPTRGLARGLQRQVSVGEPYGMLRRAGPGIFTKPGVH